jgi:hypothetical protein
MKPLNLDNRPCSPISSNCVIYQGPDIPCIKLCTGDAVSDVIAKLGTELCTIMDQLNVTNYDLSCLDINACPPADFQALIQLLIDKICEANGVTVTPEKASGCPDCVVSVAPCFVQGNQTTMQLVDYVQMIANRVCSILDQISVINNQITNIDNRVTVLENTPPPTFTLPSIDTECLATYMGNVASAPIDQVLNTLLNNDTIGYCALIQATGEPAEILSAVASQCISSSDPSLASLSEGDSPVEPMSTYYNGTWINSAVTAADAINNLWISICDIRTYVINNTLTVEDTNSINLDYTSGLLKANIQDTGWHNLEGFNYYTGALATRKPQCRRIGNEIHFRGVIYVPLATSITGATVINLTDPLAYSTVTQITPYQGIGGIYIEPTTDTSYFNSNGVAGQSVVPITVLDVGTNIDNEYRVNGILGFRKIVIGSNLVALSTNFGISITTDKKLKLTSLKAFEWEATYGILAGSPLRFTTSNIRFGEYIPNYIAAGSDIHNAPSNANFPLVSDTYNVTWPFTCNAAEADNIGGFGFVLDGLKAFVSQCTADIKNYNCP